MENHTMVHQVKRKYQTLDSSLKNDQLFAINLASLATAPIPGLALERLAQIQTGSRSQLECLAKKIIQSRTSHMPSASDYGILPPTLLRDMNIEEKVNGFVIPRHKPYVHSSVGLSLPFSSTTKIVKDEPCSAKSKKRRILERKNASMSSLKAESTLLTSTPATAADAGPYVSTLPTFSPVLPFPFTKPSTCPSLPPANLSLLNMLSTKQIQTQQFKPHNSNFSPKPFALDDAQKHKDHCLKLLKKCSLTRFDNKDESIKASKDVIDQPKRSESDKDSNPTSTKIVSRTDTTPNKRKTFPRSLYEMLQEQHNHDIISWLPDGKGFKIHSRIEFERDLLWKHFKGIKFRSFQRQLNIYGFERLEEYESPAYKHDFFVRDQEHLINNIKRVPIKKEHASKSYDSSSLKSLEGDVVLGTPV